LNSIEMDERAALAATRWEHGSFFFLPNVGAQYGSAFVRLESSNLRDYGSGRMSLQVLIDHGVACRGWRRLWIPSYYCEDVVEALDCESISIERYPFVPGESVKFPVSQDGDSLLRSSCFGWPVDSSQQFSGDVVDDFSHAPAWLARSQADFAFASLRKCLPLPDGALLWSPADHELPPEPELTSQHEQLALLRLAAMAQKRAYLAGARLDKSTYRGLEVSTESALQARPVSSMSLWSRMLLERFLLEEWNERRRQNYRVFADAMVGASNIELIKPPEGSDPMIAVLRLENAAQRDPLRQSLIERSIYTAVLWPPPEGNPDWYGAAERCFSETTLCVHVDGRYSSEDLARVAAAIREIMAEGFVPT
jgi:hypothetical protein